MRILALIIILQAFILNAQHGILMDSDGYVNLRSGKSDTSEILMKLDTGLLVIYSAHKASEWYDVYIVMDSMSKGNVENSYATGYVHNSRVAIIGRQGGFEIDTISKFEIETEDFDTSKNEITLVNGYVSRINGKVHYGTDGGIPRKSVKSISFKKKESKIALPSDYFDDLYEYKSRNHSIYRRGNSYIVLGWGSDGAGGYSVAWYFRNEKLVQRLVWNGY